MNRFLSKLAILAALVSLTTPLGTQAVSSLLEPSHSLQLTAEGADRDSSRTSSPVSDQCAVRCLTDAANDSIGLTWGSRYMNPDLALEGRSSFFGVYPDLDTLATESTAGPVRDGPAWLLTVIKRE